jgi:hypothetical protein
MDAEPELVERGGEVEHVPMLTVKSTRAPGLGRIE